MCLLSLELSSQCLKIPQKVSFCNFSFLRNETFLEFSNTLLSLEFERTWRSLKLERQFISYQVSLIQFEVWFPFTALQVQHELREWCGRPLHFWKPGVLNPAFVFLAASKSRLSEWDQSQVFAGHLQFNTRSTTRQRYQSGIYHQLSQQQVLLHPKNFTTRRAR